MLTLQLSNPSSGLSYVSDSYLTAYLNYTVDIAVYLGADRDFAKDQLQESLYFQTELKNVSYVPITSTNL